MMTPERLLAIPIGCAVGVVFWVLFCEWLQARRISKVAALAFGPAAEPRQWTKAVPWFRAAALGGITWALVYLLLTPETLFLDPNSTDDVDEEQIEHVMLLLDFSPSMTLIDAGETGEISRKEQMTNVVTSIAERFGKHVRYSLVCFYVKPMPMVENATDKAILYNILDELPIEQVMGPGKTDLAKAVSKGLQLSVEKREASTTLILITDGDTVELDDLHYLPPSIKHALVLGVGNTKEGISIDGHLSRQDPAALSFMANYLKGDYLDLNQKLLPSDEISHLVQAEDAMVKRRWNLADVAMLVFIASACLYAFLPVLQEYLGSNWRAVRRPKRVAA